MLALMSSVTPEQLAEWVHGALSRLYDSAYLDKHPLTKLLMADQPAMAQPGQTLRRKLLDAIRDLRPGPGVPAQSPDWRAYRILELRYIEGREAAEVMRQLALGRSQYYWYFGLSRDGPGSTRCIAHLALTHDSGSDSDPNQPIRRRRRVFHHSGLCCSRGSQPALINASSRPACACLADGRPAYTSPADTPRAASPAA